MTGPRTFYVTPVGADAFRVTLDDRGDRCEARIERGGRAWTIPIEPGGSADRVRIEGRPRRWSWRPVEGGPGRLVVDGREHRLTVETQIQHRLRSMGRTAAGERSAREVRAPMPGLVLEVRVADGDRVEAGAGLAVIEAMKMENEVAAPIAGVVRDLAVARGAPIEGSALVCRIDPGDGA